MVKRTACLDSSQFRVAIRSSVLAALFCLLACAPSYCAQLFDASALQKPSFIEGAWHVHAGDDPTWANPQFDDSDWMLVDPRRNLLEYFPRERPEILWYRIRVKVAPYQTHLALQEYRLSHAFQIFVNGERLLANGRVIPYRPYTYFADLVMDIPQKVVESGELVIALRVHLSRGEWSAPMPGLNFDNLLIGRRAALDDGLLLRHITTYAASGLTMLLGMVVGVLALALYSVQRTRTEYAWMLVAAIGFLVMFLWQMLLKTRNLPLSWAVIFDGLLMLWVVLAPVYMYLAFLKAGISRRMGIVLGLASALALLELIGGDYDWMSPSVRLTLSMPLLLVAHVAVPILLFVHFRRGNRESGILLIPALLQGVAANFRVVVGALAWIPSLSTWSDDFSQRMANYHVGPFAVQLADIGNGLFWIALGTILVMRTVRISHEEARMESDLEAARQVQRVIVPEKLDASPGFTVEAVYRPAQQVGGDFYQVWPTPDGGLLLVLGDVAGKGLPAAMQVAVLVGSIGTLAQITSDPSQILCEMNARLLGKTNGAFSTCLALRLNADGNGVLASAGHPAPYLDGKEIELPGALPLGIAQCQGYELRKLVLEPGSRIASYSDGVLEAQNAKGELLGFERTRELSRLDALQIADAASAFGQQDDITVVVIQRGTTAVEAG
jgi:phosphoserine phosphatase RsbU/P